MLHVVSHPPSHFDKNALLASLNQNDAVMLIQSAVVIAVANTQLLNLLIESKVIVYALKADLQARGLLTLASSLVSVIDYPDFVDLTVEQTPQIAW